MHGTYNYTVVHQFAVMTIVWGIVGMLVGVVIAAQLAWPALNFDIPWLTYGRLRPLHTNAVIFAFGGCALFATSYYVVQRTCHVRLICRQLAAFTFWGWQAVIVLAAVAMLHIVNSAVIPVSLWKSYSLYAGVQDAMVQWWYGHNAVGFFLTAGFLGIMYYFVPKQAGRPISSYRLSVVHFWSLVFTYMWAGPHHLHYTALPDWAQSLGMVMSLILLAPSWGGMINGIMTLSGAWEKLRTDPVLRFLIVSVSFYGMSTFEGPMMSIKTVNALSHYTDWTIGHVHSGALGWVAFVSIGAMYYLTPPSALRASPTRYGSTAARRRTCATASRKAAKAGCPPTGSSSARPGCTYSRPGSGASRSADRAAGDVARWRRARAPNAARADPCSRSRSSSRG